MASSKAKKSEALKSFERAANAYQRAYNSKNHQYWLAHEDESCNGWDLKRLYPYRKAAEQAKDRVSDLELAVHDIYDNASKEDREAMEAADRHFIITC